jgi:hypothetical protein
MQPDPARARFWQWFARNGERLRTDLYGPDDDARTSASDELRKAVEAAVPGGLVLELGRAEEGQPHQLIVSADGRLERVDVVKQFVASAPQLPGWTVVPFRARMEIADSLEIVLQGEQVGPADIWFRVAEDEDGLDLTLCVHGLNEQNQRLRGLGASLLAEHAVGERDALTLINSLHVLPCPESPEAEGLRPFRDLVTVFDQARARRYPPPGSLPLDQEGSWGVMSGTINSAFASVMINTGLRGLVGHPAYDRRLTVTILCNETRDDGMPATEEEYLAVRDLGDRLSDALQKDQQSLPALTIMTQGRRDLVFYTTNPGAALLRLEPLRDAEQTHRTRATFEYDTFWGFYRQFHRAGQGDDTEE